jgi:hypothetical protein
MKKIENTKTLDYDGEPNSKQVYFISDSELNKLIN